MKLYHGTILQHAINILENGIDLKKSKPFLDFGRGFYTTPDIEMARNMAFRIAGIVIQRRGINNTFPRVLTFEYEEVPELAYKKFEQENVLNMIL